MDLTSQNLRGPQHDAIPVCHHMICPFIAQNLSASDSQLAISTNSLSMVSNMLLVYEIS